MIHLFKKIIITLFIIFFITLNINNSSAVNSKKNQYISLHPLSSSYDIKKFQKFFKALKIYKGDIDGKYKNIKPYIVNFQIKNKIIKSNRENGAGYIGPKTYSFFEKKYGKKFKKAYSNFFKIKEPKSGEKKYFIVSAYYSPLPGQKRYSTGTYSGDIRLNGNGTHGASGAGVHPGFIAAPSNYPFGTKIQLKGLGVGVVEDRGGAIVRVGVRGHDADRLDIWMGYGDEGLNRALKWGKKKVSGKILNKNTKITISFPTEHKEYLAKKIKPESKNEDIKKMQKLFLNAKLYSGKIDGKYSSFKKAIISYQIKNKIIKNKESYDAGYIGNKTIKKLELQYPKIFILLRREDLEKNKNSILKSKNIPENKKGNIPEKTNKNNAPCKKCPWGENKLIVKSGTTEKILAKYKITEKGKIQIEKIAKKVLKKINNKTKNNNLKRKTQINNFRQKVEKIIIKIKNQKTKNRLIYLKDILKEMSK